MIVIAEKEELCLVEDKKEPILITGAGALNVMTALRNIPRDTPIVNIGYAGSNTIPIGTKCHIGKVAVTHPNAKFQDKTYSLDGDTPCYSAADFVTATDIERPCVFDMELAYILALGFTNVTAEKVVSDNLSLREYEECLKKPL